MYAQTSFTGLQSNLVVVALVRLTFLFVGTPNNTLCK